MTEWIAAECHGPALRVLEDLLLCCTSVKGFRASRLEVIAMNRAGANIHYLHSPCLGAYLRGMERLSQSSKRVGPMRGLSPGVRL